MSVHPKKDKIEKPTDRGMVQVTAHGGDQAPIVYFDGPVAFGFVGNIVQLELGASVCVPVNANGKAEVRNRTVIVAHLRATHAVMAALADAIEKALMLTGVLQADKPVDKPVDKKEKADA